MKFNIKAKVITCVIALSALVGCATAPELVNGVKDVTYTTVTESFDWGPAITKVVVDFGGKLDAESVTADMFSVSSVRTFKDFDFATFSLKEEASDHEAEREIVAAYVSDAEGNETEKGTFVTLEMKVGPTLSEGSPYNYEFASGFNVLVDTSYKISMNGSIAYKGGTPVTIETTGAAESAGNINLIADDFVNDVKFTYGDITLGYASFKPEAAKAGSTPLIIWLHGAGEGGTNTLINIMG